MYENISGIHMVMHLVFFGKTGVTLVLLLALKKMEGKHVINISNDGIPQVDSQGVLHSTTSVALEASP
jgi:hypothetical protein